MPKKSNRWAELPANTSLKISQKQIDVIWKTYISNNDVEGLQVVLNQNMTPSLKTSERKWGWVMQSFIDGSLDVFDWLMKSSSLKQEFFKDAKKADHLTILAAHCDVSDYLVNRHEPEYKEAWKKIEKIWPVLMSPDNIVLDAKKRSFGSAMLESYFPDAKGPKWKKILATPEMCIALDIKRKNGLTTWDEIRKNSMDYRDPFDPKPEARFNHNMDEIQQLVLSSRLKSLPVASGQKIKTRL